MALIQITRVKADPGQNNMCWPQIFLHKKVIIKIGWFMVTEERSEYNRTDYNLPTLYRFSKKIEEGKYNTSSFLKGRCKDFSGGGLALMATKPIPPNTLLYIEINIAQEGASILATGEVVRRQKTSFKGKEVYLLCIRFIILDENNRTKLISFRPPNPQSRVN